jgi:hypothetical protein
MNYKTIANIETINILLTVLQLALPLITNSDLNQEIQTMITTAKNFSNFPSTRPETFHNTLTQPFTPSPTNGLSLPTQLRSLQSKIFFLNLSLFYSVQNIIHSRGCIHR